VDAVGSDDDVRGEDPTVLRADRGTGRSGVIDSHDPSGDLHGDRLTRAVCPGGSLQEDLVEVGPVEVEIGSSELVPSLCPQRGLRQDLARAPAATDGLLDDQRRRVQSLAHAEPIEDAGGVGPDLQPGTDLAESWGLLE